jgi:hypothetical protein
MIYISGKIFDKDILKMRIYRIFPVWREQAAAV